MDSSKPPRKRASRFEKDQRIDSVCALIIQARCTEAQVKQSIMKTYGVSYKTADRDFEEAQDRLRNKIARDPQLALAIEVERCEQLYFDEKNSAKPNRSTMNQISKTKLQIVDTAVQYTEKNHHDTTVPFESTLSPELEKALKRHDLFG